MTASELKQLSNAIQNWGLWKENAGLPAGSISLFGVQGRRFILIKKGDPLITRLWNSLLAMLGLIDTRKQAQNDLYNKTISFLNDPQALQLLEKLPFTKTQPSAPPSAKGPGKDGSGEEHMRLLQDSRELAQNLAKQLAETQSALADTARANAVLNNEKEKLEQEKQSLGEEKVVLECKLDDLKEQLTSLKEKWETFQESKPLTPPDSPPILPRKEALSTAGETAFKELQEKVNDIQKQLDYWQERHTKAATELSQLKTPSSDHFRLFFASCLENKEFLKVIDQQRSGQTESLLKKLLKNYYKAKPEGFLQMVNSIRIAKNAS